MKLTSQQIITFQELVWSFYHDYGRSFAWRNIDDPYKVLVSEIMLQQTQTYRVIEKYDLFIEEFPSIIRLAQASLRDVLSLWQGLGYNRRGKYLHEIAQRIVENFNGQLPDDPAILETFKGLGKATAASIVAFAYNKPTVFIETNIRAVYIHSFFEHHKKLDDTDLIPLIEQTLDKENPREWYYALMDYGVMLKKKFNNPARKSKHYTKQSKFEGSDRQIRGKIIKLLTEHRQLSLQTILSQMKNNPARIERIVNDLIKEKLIQCCAQNIQIMQ